MGSLGHKLYPRQVSSDLDAGKILTFFLVSSQDVEIFLFPIDLKLGLGVGQALKRRCAKFQINWASGFVQKSKRNIFGRLEKFLNFFFLIKIRFGRLVMRLLKNGGDAGFQLILLTGIGQEVIKFFFFCGKKGCLIFFQENLKTG